MAGTIEQERLLYRMPEAAEMLGVGRTMVYELVTRGDLNAVRVGSGLRIAREDLLAYVARLRAERDAERDDVARPDR